MSPITEKLALIRNTPLSDHWEDTQQSFPQTPLPFLQPQAIAKTGALASLPPEAIAFAQEAASIIASDPDLTRLAWHAHHVLFIGKTCPRSDVRDWPLLTPLLGNHGGTFYLLVILSGLPRIREIHQSLNVPEDIARDTYSDTCVWARQYHNIGVTRDGRFFHPGSPGAWGLDTRYMPWILNHLYNDLYRVGRLQYKTGPFRQSLRAYYNRKSGHHCLLAESGLRFRADGCFDGAGGIVDPDGAWMTELVETPQSVSGNVIHPSGKARRTRRTLPLDTWERVLTQGDPILEIHIPEDGRMGFDDCGESLRQVIDFFSTTFPDRPFKAICCTSWFLDPTYQTLLSELSNIARFQRECYLFPLHSTGGRSGIERIFYQYAHDLSTAPRDTSMRRAVLDHLEGDGVLVSGGCLLFPDNLNWGTQTYLNQFQN
ncbi:MAG: acyltransferase domain-containing protein [bacterium]|nr:acyltransferase domain-containing protein [bacterium]